VGQLAALIPWFPGPGAEEKSQLAAFNQAFNQAFNRAGKALRIVLLRCREGFVRYLQPSREWTGLVFCIVNSPWEN
jgi:hypothetical protein